MKKRPTAAELDTALADLKAKLGEERVLNGALPLRIRAHRGDFIAVPKHAPQQFMVVRRTRSAIIVRPYCQPELYSRLITRLKSILAADTSRFVRWHRRQLAKSPTQPAWLAYTAKTFHESINRFIDK